MLDPSQGLACFTDGSSATKDGSGGWAFCVIDSFGGEYSASGGVGDTTNNRMEQQAWCEGLEWVSRTYGPCDVLMYSDSEYVGLGAMDRSRRRAKNVDLWGRIDAAIDAHHSVEFVHVRGHQDSHYNCLVDELAGEARISLRDKVSL